MKKCKDCWEPRNHNNALISRCIPCQTEFTNSRKKKPKSIAYKSKTNKNTPAKFTQEVKDKILARDKVCIISWNPIEEYHHAFFGWNANRWPNRNDVNQWVGLSADVHRIIHHASPKESQQAKIYRLKCMVYLQEMYN